MQQETNRPRAHPKAPQEPKFGHYEIDGGPDDGALVFHRYYPDTGETVYTDQGGQWMEVMPWDTVPVQR